MPLTIQDGRNCRFSIADCRLLTDIENICHTTFQSAMMELRIFDCRLSIADGHWKELPHHFLNRQSAISNRQSKPGGTHLQEA
jgi:hypothetical protein